MPRGRCGVSAGRITLGCLLLAGAAGVANAQIYTCIDASGKKLTSDRPIPACNDREQRVLNSDGSVRRIVPPTPTADERTEIEARQQRDALAAANQREAIRRDRNLLMRFPNEAAHKKAREASLEDTRKSLKVSETRLELLQKERKPLLDEAEFYIGRTMPPKLKQQLEGNEAATEAQRSLIVNQQAELVRINALYDDELERLRKLWSGAQPGSLGVVAKPADAGGAASGPRRPSP
jgi:Domain of unknown function (DUF4124)